MKSMWEDVRFALRVLRKSPGFAVAAILCLALGIGANTVVFSVVYRLFIRPLPYTDARELVRVDRNSSHDAVTFDEYEFWKRNTPGFAIATGHRGAEERSLVLGDNRDWIRVMPITSDFFHTLNVQFFLGRWKQGVISSASTLRTTKAICVRGAKRTTRECEKEIWRSRLHSARPKAGRISTFPCRRAGNP